VDARPILETVARVLDEHGLEAILIGNAAAALQGAPVTTVDLDFLIRKTPRNLQKLTAVAKTLGAMVLRPHYPVSGLYRLMRDDDGLQLDFMTAIHGAKSFESLRGKSHAHDFAGHALWVAGLEAVIASKRAAGRPRDKAVLDTLEKALHETETLNAKTTTRRPASGK
jgi:predicted nucleotidyltransferase